MGNMRSFQPRKPETSEAPGSSFVLPIRQPATSQSALSSPIITPAAQITAEYAAHSGYSFEQLPLFPSNLNDALRQSAAHTVLQMVPQTQTVLSETAEPAASSTNTTGLPDGLKAGIEALTSIALDDVRVHYNSAQPARLQALAYTQGTNIHVGPGQEGHLAHEAWHVVQQKQGRVQPTLQTKSGALNDDCQLEHEADIMGNRAMQTSPDIISEKGTVEQAQPAGLLQLRASRPVIQRAVGFEMQTSMAVRDKAGERIGYQTEIYVDYKEDQSPGKTALTTKKGEPGGKYYEISADSGGVPSTEAAATDVIKLGEQKIRAMTTSVLEFVTPPYELPEEVQVLGRRLDHMRTALRTTTKEATVPTTIEIVITRYEQMLQRDKNIVVDNSNRATGIKLAEAIIGQDGGASGLNMAVAPQSTMGVTLTNLLAFVKELLKSGDPQLIAPFWLKELPRHMEQASKYAMPDDAQGLAFLVNTYLLGGSKQEEIFSYPKQAIPLMARTDFHSMFLTLSSASKKAFQTVFLPTIADTDEQVFNVGFPAATERNATSKDEKNLVSKGPKVRDWVSSIVTPEEYPLDEYDTDRIWSSLRFLYGIVLKDKSAEQIIAAVQQSSYTEDEKQSTLEMHRNLSSHEAILLKKDSDEVIIDLLSVLDEKDGFTTLMMSEWDKAILIQRDLQSRDLMSRGAVGKSATSMGAIKVPQKGSEVEMAILENRMMTGWDDKQVDDLWAQTLPDIFIRTQALLTSENQSKSSIDRKRELSDSDSDTEDKPLAKQQAVSPREKVITLGLQHLDRIKQKWQAEHPNGGMESADPPDYDTWENAIGTIADDSQAEMMAAVKKILQSAAKQYQS